MRVARHDPAVALALRRIIGLVDPPFSLLRPSIAFRVLFGDAEIAPKEGKSRRRLRRPGFRSTAPR